MKVSNSSLRTLTWFPFVIFSCGHHSNYCMIGSWLTTPWSDWLEGSIWIWCEAQAWCRRLYCASWLEAGIKPSDICLSPEAAGSGRRRHTHRVTMKQMSCRDAQHRWGDSHTRVLISYGSSQGHWPTVSNKTTSHNDLAQMTTDQQ